MLVTTQHPWAQRKAPAAPAQRSSAQREQRGASVQRSSAQREQRWGLNLALLVHDAPFREFAVFDEALSDWYAQQYLPWKVGRAGMGLALGLAYDITFPNRGMFRVQFQLETTGWISGIFDIGGGVRIPLGKNMRLSVEGYFSWAQTGGTLARISNHGDTRLLYVAQFGLKFRSSLEFALARNWYLSPYISFAAYPWSVGNLSPLFISGAALGVITDSLQLGIEFGQKF